MFCISFVSPLYLFCISFVSPLCLLCVYFVSVGSEHSKLYVDWMGWDGYLNAPVIWAPYGANKGSTEARAEFLYQITSSNYWLAQKENVSSRSWSASLLWTWGTINININPKIVITFIIANRNEKGFYLNLSDTNSRLAKLCSPSVQQFYAQ